jgi:uncharacterized protein YqjF (DUF2071 family)
LRAVWLALVLRDLVLASWETDEASLARALPAGVHPATVDGVYLVSLVALRAEAARLGRLPVPRFSQLEVATYVERDGPAVFFLAGRVTLPAAPAVLFGLPYRPARLHVRDGRADAAGVGVSLRYRRGGPAGPAPLEFSDVGLVEAGGLRAFRVRSSEIPWEGAALTEPPRHDVLLALGFRLAGAPSLVYAERFDFAIEVPPRRVSSSSSRTAR